MEYSFLSSIPLNPLLLHIWLCIIDRGNADSWVWVTGNLISWWRNKAGGAASMLLCQFLPHAFLPGLHPDWLRRGRANLGLTNEVTFPWNWIKHRLLTVPLLALQLWPHDTFPAHFLPLPSCTLCCGHTWLLPVFCEHLVFSSLYALAHDVPAWNGLWPSVGSLKSYPCFISAQLLSATCSLHSFYLLLFFLVWVFSNVHTSKQLYNELLCTHLPPSLNNYLRSLKQHLIPTSLSSPSSSYVLCLTYIYWIEWKEGESVRLECSVYSLPAIGKLRPWEVKWSA